MRILIGGGSGFLGRALTRRLLDDGARVTWASRDAGRDAPAGVEVRTYDGLDPADGFDAVVNLAGAGIADRPWTQARRRLLLDSRLGPTRALVAWIRAARVRPRVLLGASAIGWYGAQGDVALDESSAPKPEFQHALCAAWEDASREAEAAGVPVVLLRTGVVLHAGGGMLARLRLPFSLGLGARLGNGAQVLSWIALDDWVDAVTWLLRAHVESPAGVPAPAAPTGAFNLTSPEPVRNGAFTEAWARALRRPALLGMPAPVLRAALGEMATLLVDGQRVLPARLQAAGFVFRHPHLEPWLRAQAAAA